MPYYLIKFHRKKGLLLFWEFSEDVRRVVQEVAMELELSERYDRNIRVAVIHAESEEALRESHANFFETPMSLLQKLRNSVLGKCAK